MAWRIDQPVIRGEIDNRTRGRVTGRIWFVGRDDPVELDLAGDAWRDLAGRRLEFVNPDPKPQDLAGFGARQTGTIGDCTASRKVKVPEIPLEEIGDYYAARKPFPWHWGNSLYLEWFSTGNGRVVIESASYQLTIDPDVTWEMTVAEEEAQRRANAEGMAGFFMQLGQTVADAHKAKSDAVDDASPSGENEAPADAEPSPADGDPNDLLNAPAPEFETVGGLPPPPQHPLAQRAFALHQRLRQEATEQNWVAADATDADPLADLILSIRRAARHFADALNPQTWPPPEPRQEATLAGLQRARAFLSHALLAAAFCAQEKLVDDNWLAGFQREANAICHQGDLLTGELRSLQPGNSE